jgi:hypothetical protein
MSRTGDRAPTLDPAQLRSYRRLAVGLPRARLAGRFDPERRYLPRARDAGK